MSNQLQITGGAKVRNLDGVITGSTGVLGSLPINGANGIPQLDSSGKILVSQLPNSVMEYKGTWNVTTNNPYLVDGTGNAGDVYIVTNAATGGTTHDFGAGPILFYNGDQAIYDGSAWQRAAGSSGTVTSVAVTESGDALSITGSPITTSGTINIGFAGSSSQYVAGDGSLITFPTVVTQAQNLVTEVYNETGATLTKGTVVYINGGHGNLPTVTKALATSDATSAQTYGVVRTDITNNNNGYVTVIGNLDNLDTQAYAAGTQLYLSSTTAGAWTDVKQYAPAHLVYVGIVTRSHPTQGVVEVKIQNGFELDELHNVSAQTPSNNQGLFYNSSNSLWENKSIATALGYTPANASLYVPYTGATTNVDLGTNNLTAYNIYSSYLFGVENNLGNAYFGGMLRLYRSGTFTTDVNYSNIFAKNTTSLSLYLGSGTNYKQADFDLSGLTNNTLRTYALPDASGTIALTSDIPSLSGYVTLATNQSITGIKDFDNGINVNNYPIRSEVGIALDYTIGASASSTATTFGGLSDGYQVNLASGAYNNFRFANTTVGKTYTFPNASGTIALTSDITSISATAPISYSAGVISISQATTSTDGYLSSTDWNTFNGKQNALTNPVTGTGASGQVTYFNGSTTVTGNNNFFWDSGNSRLGIGTTTPSTRLHVVGDIYSTTGMFIGNSGGYFMTLNTLNGMYIDSTNYLTLNTNGTEKLRLTSGGNLGIGTSSPNRLLTIKNSSDGVNGIGFQNHASTAELGYIRYEQTNDILDIVNNSAYASGGIKLSTSGVERLRITSGGNVGIGTTAPNVSGQGANVKVLTVQGNTSYGVIEVGTNQNTSDGVLCGAYGFSNSLLNSGYTLPAYIGSWLSGGGATSGGDLRFHTQSSGSAGASERMRITSAGSVGIGTTSPNRALVVSGGNSEQLVLISSTTNSGISLNPSNTTFSPYIGGTGNDIIMQTQGSERMRITSGGLVYVNTTSGDGRISVNFDANSTSGIAYLETSGIGNAAYCVFKNQSGTEIGSIRRVSTSNVVAYNTTSDYRLKEDFKPLSGLNKVLSIKTYDYKWKGTEDRMDGVIAHELAEVLPYAVSGEKDGEQMQQVDYSKIVPVLIKAIQELKAEIDELKNK